MTRRVYVPTYVQYVLGTLNFFGMFALKSGGSFFTSFRWEDSDERVVLEVYTFFI